MIEIRTCTGTMLRWSSVVIGGIFMLYPLVSTNSSLHSCSSEPSLGKKDTMSILPTWSQVKNEDHSYCQGSFNHPVHTASPDCLGPHLWILSHPQASLSAAPHTSFGQFPNQMEKVFITLEMIFFRLLLFGKHVFYLDCESPLPLWKLLAHAKLVRASSRRKILRSTLVPLSN